MVSYLNLIKLKYKGQLASNIEIHEQQPNPYAYLDYATRWERELQFAEVLELSEHQRNLNADQNDQQHKDENPTLPLLVSQVL